MTTDKQFAVKYTLTGGDCNAQQRMPITLLAQKVIEVATLHANLIGVGYDDLIQQGKAWVLSRMSIQVIRFPRINEDYTVATWVSSVNRRFSERDFTLTDANGIPFAHVRTVWITLNLADRTMGDLSGITGLNDALIDGCHAPIPPFPRLGPVASDSVVKYSYQFAYSDLDANRHVNSVVYLRLMNNCWPLEHYDTHRISRVDIAFVHEAYYGSTAQITHTAKDNGIDEITIATDNNIHARILVAWAEIDAKMHNGN